MLRLIAFVLPLGVDSFAVAAALGAAGVTGAAARWRVSALFTAFEAGMPLAGLAIGGGLAAVIGGVADYVAAGLLILFGTWLLVAGERTEDREQRQAAQLASANGWAMLGLGLSISMDELAIGFSLGLVRLPVLPVVVALGVQAFLAAQLGILVGAKVGGRFRENAERLAALALIGLGIYVLVSQAVRA